MKTNNFHESYASGEINPPSERSTGLVFTAVAVIVAVLWRGRPPVLWAALGLALLLLTASLLAPTLLKPLNVAWFRAGLLLHNIVNPLVMSAIFVLVFVPAGLLMRIRHDPLRSRRATDASTYWIDRKDAYVSSMTRQF
ncbi:MAG: hypothetical protein F9K29_18105 [Hyphomicrobiaceae bacterium]|nr:MAG: hypothetical protein F9K29_18105 [Hyphomicrobiaceae bacterium]